MVMFKAKFRPLVAEKPRARPAAQQQQQPQPVPPHSDEERKPPPPEKENGPQVPVELPGQENPPERVDQEAVSPA